MEDTIKKIKIAINKNDKIFNHSGSWTSAWIEYCEKEKISFKIVDCYQPDVISDLQNCNCLLWHIGNYVLPDMLFGRSILNSAKNMKLNVFPDWNTSWHFDDKIAQTYLLESINAPLPDSWMFYLFEDCEKWINNLAKFPVIAKLKSGSGSNNVKLLKSKNEALKYARKMFNNGFKSQPGIFFKTKSQLLSAKNFDVIKARFKRIPEFLHTLSRAKMFPNEKGYVFFQDCIPNDGYDLKIIVIGDKLSFIGRKSRKGDFRASGGGDLFYDRNFVSENIISSAFSISDKLEFQCMGYDYVIDKNSGIGKIVEMSYGFSHKALLDSGGYFNRNGQWIDEPLNAPEEIIKNLIQRI